MRCRKMKKGDSDIQIVYRAIFDTQMIHQEFYYTPKLTFMETMNTTVWCLA